METKSVTITSLMFEDYTGLNFSGLGFFLFFFCFFFQKELMKEKFDSSFQLFQTNYSVNEQWM